MAWLHQAKVKLGNASWHMKVGQLTCHLLFDWLPHQPASLTAYPALSIHPQWLACPHIP